jgi:hypothetical protein
VGDLLLFLVTTPGNGKTATKGTSAAQTAAVVAEITGLPNNTTIDFAAGDALNFNQAADCTQQSGLHDYHPGSAP